MHYEYSELSSAEKSIFDVSERIGPIQFRNPARIARLFSEFERAHASHSYARLQKCTQRLVSAMCEDLGVPQVGVRVLDYIPRDAFGDLHGYYEPASEGKVAEIGLCTVRSITMRHVSCRRLLEFLIHELSHHLDLTLFELGDSFHTKGFRRRQRTLIRQITGTS